jgi:rubrerythrin
LIHSIGRGTKDVLEVCQSVELSCAELYHYFAEIFKEDRDSFLLWLKTAMEEENHGRLFALVAKLQRRNIVKSIRIELIDAEIALIYIQSLIEKVKRTPPSLEEALRIALDLEKKLDCLIMKNSVDFADQSYEKTFLAITKYDAKHFESIQKAYDRTISAGS